MNSSFGARTAWAALMVSILFAGCARSPSSPGNIVRSSNRIETTLTLSGTLNNSYFYGVAFDDEAGDGIGPRALEGNSLDSLNGIMGGNFRVLVLYHLGQFEIYHRTDPANPATERRILNGSTATPLFVGTPRATNNGLIFTLDLDAKITDNSTGPDVFFFPARNAAGGLLTSRLDINYALSSDLIRPSADLRIKPVDANDFQAVSTPIADLQIDTTRVVDISDPLNDRRPGVDASYNRVDFAQIDSINLRLAITRG